MFLPLGTDRPLTRPTRITHALIGVNIAVFVGELLLQRFQPNLAEEFRRSFWLRGAALTPWGFLTYQFLHGGFLHLAGNMLFLYVFGPNIEDRIGRAWFLAFYLVGGVVAGAAHAIWVPAAPVVGASGSISAVTGAFLVFFPRTTIRVFIFFFIIGVVNIPAAWFIGFQIFYNLFSQGAGGGPGVAYLAHLGGYAFGAVVAYSVLATGLLPREPYDLFSMGRQARRRRAFKELTSRGHDPWGAGSKEDSPPGGSGKGIRQSSARRALKHAEPNEKLQRAISERRSSISSLIADGQLASAADSYRELRREHGLIALSRDAQLTIANHYFTVGDYKDAGEAYELFLEKRERDHDSPRIRLMLALLSARHLDRPERARQLLKNLPDILHDEGQRRLAESLSAELAASAGAAQPDAQAGRRAPGDDDLESSDAQFVKKSSQGHPQ